MNIKFTQKVQILALAMTIAIGLIPAISHASFFDWLGNAGNDKMDINNYPILQSSFFYAHSSFMQLNKDEQSPPTVTIESNSVVQPTSELTVVKGKTVTTSVKKTMKVRLTAYSSTPDQTDDSPFITAKGTRVRDGIVAVNFLPFNTLIKIPAIYGDKIFVVEDRMNARFTNYVDIWFPDRESAIQFGSKTAEIVVVGSL